MRQSTAEPLGGDRQRGLNRRHRGTVCPCTRHRLLTATGQAGDAPQGTPSSASGRPLEAEGLIGQGHVRGVWAPQAGLEEGARVPTQRGSPGAPQRQGLCAVNPGSGVGCLFCDARGREGQGSKRTLPPLSQPGPSLLNLPGPVSLSAGRSCSGRRGHSTLSAAVDVQKSAWSLEQPPRWASSSGTNQETRPVLAELRPPSLMPRALRGLPEPQAADTCPPAGCRTAPTWGEAAAPLQPLRPQHGLWGSHSTGQASSCGRCTRGSGQGDSPGLGTLGRASRGACVLHSCRQAGCSRGRWHPPCGQVAEKLTSFLPPTPAWVGSASAPGGLEAGRRRCPRALCSSPTGLPGGCGAFLGTLPYLNPKLTSTSWNSQRPWPCPCPRGLGLLSTSHFPSPGPSSSPPHATAHTCRGARRGAAATRKPPLANVWTL